MAKQQACTGRFASGDLKPGNEAFRCCIKPFFAGQIQLTIGTDKAHAGEVINNQALAVCPPQAFLPAIGQVAVHIAEEILALVSLQNGLNLLRQTSGLACTPGGWNPGVGHTPVAAFVEHNQGLKSEPVHQFITIRCTKYGHQRIVVAHRLTAIMNGEQVQIMISQHTAGPVAEAFAAGAAWGSDRPRPARNCNTIAPRSFPISVGGALCAPRLGKKPRPKDLTALESTERCRALTQHRWDSKASDPRRSLCTKH